ncbi:hypothetical protein [Aeromonas caviae]|uniref:hypothetical protein n=1 Tax=Aeromonas caviae TaxID=648 RepID=UPI001CC71C14|nr:hypothetical protein [Aeromonas caviae]GJB04871.1 hypothetical protein KAM360_38140 [Aeromonas caviae]
MITKEIVDFLLPDFADPIQVAFMCILLVMISSTIISTQLVAKPSSWEKKWNKGTPDDDSDDLDIEHGSVTDLWHAVATAPEKVADIMPGMLLVVGLLGTFLGLGMALNHASNILGQPDAMNASSAASSMHDLLGLLQGLGTKFKTSTWGICGFVLLKITSELTRFDEKRLAWVINKVKEQINQRKQHSFDTEERKQQQLFDQMQHITNGVANALTKNIALLLDNNNNNNVAYERELKSVNTHIVELKSCNLDIGSSVNKAIDAQTLMLGKYLQGIQNSALNNINVMKNELKAIDKNFAEYRADYNEQCDKQAKTVDSQTSILCEYLQCIKSNTADTMKSMNHFTQSTEVIVNNMADAADKMAVGADKVGDASVELVDAVGLFKTQFTDVLDNVRHDLGAAITNMSIQASETLERGSQQLGEATKEISAALGQLSLDVKVTMANVQGSITEALNIQKAASIAFTSSTDTLNEGIVETISTVQELANKITEGLDSISSSNRKMEAVGKAIDKSNKNLEGVVTNLVQLPMTLEPLKHLTNTPEQFVTIATLLQHIEKTLKQLPGNLEPLKQLDDVLPQFKAVLSSLNELQTNLEPIHLLADNTGKAASNTQMIATVSDNTNAMLHVLKELRNDIHVATRHEAAPEMAN